ncbi:autotransporter outer membrane beta-barrel domain-containing protein [Bibersteinia trehalosi]|nr:autotransporter outer membrane beta-barrel domain-containing protein [Bibersteinia trehalosi]
MRNVRLFPLSALSLALFGQSVYAAEVSHTCSVSTDCNYRISIVTTDNASTGESKIERFWSAHSNRLGNHNDDLKAKLIAQHYQNTPASSYDPQGSTFDLISITQLDTTRKAHLYIPSGTTATLDKIGVGTGRLVYLYNADGQIDSGVTLTVGSGQSEEDDSPLMAAAIYLGGNSKLNTSADIVLNAIEGEGIWLTDNAQLTAKNHKISLLAGDTEAVTLRNNASAIFENVAIRGTQYNQVGLIASDSASIQFNHGTVDLSSDILTIGLGLEGATLAVDNSNVSAYYAILADAYGYSDVSNNRVFTANKNTINITNSDVIGRALFVGVNTKEDIQPVSYDQATTVNVLNSRVSGRVVNLEDVSDEDADNELDIRIDTKENTNVFLTMKDSQWTVNGDSYLDTLAMANSTTTFQSDKAFQTLTISKDLIGNGHFDLNTDLANQQSDKIIVQGEDSGNFTLGIQDSGNEPQAANGKVTLVETQTGQAQFSLKDRDYVDAGAYRYRLSQDGTNWILSNRAGETNTQPDPVSEPEPQVEQPVAETPVEETVSPVVVTPVIPAIVETIPDDIPTEQPAMKALSEKSNALVSLRQAQGLLISQNLQGVHQRLGELKTDKNSNVWVKNVNGRHKAKSQAVSADSRSSGFEMDYHNLQIGADRAVSENVRLGGFVGSSRADVDFNGEYGKGKLRSQAVGLYATFANADGWYVDNVVKYERLTSQASEKRKYHAVSLSNEIGKRMIFGQNWTLTPQAQLAYHTIAGKDDEKRLNLFTARTGFRLAKGFEFANGWVVQPYAEVNGIAERSNNAKVRVNQYLFDVPESKGRLQAALGLNAGNGSHRIGIEVVQTHGNQVRQLLAAIVNYRYQW